MLDDGKPTVISAISRRCFGHNSGTSASGEVITTPDSPGRAAINAVRAGVLPKRRPRNWAEVGCAVQRSVRAT